MTKTRKTSTKAIFIEWRKPASKEERLLHGITESDHRIAKIFINSTSSKRDQVDTFFHELTHAFFTFYANNVPSAVQEELACKIGVIVTEVLK